MPGQSVHQLYKRLETIGKGAYGSVHKGLHIPSGNVVALKIINLDTADDDVADIQREVALLTQLRDAPNITKYYGCHLDGPRVWIVMELAQGGSVLSLMKVSKDNCIEERYVAIIIREVLVALAYLHKVPVIHRDMKAANILVTAVGKVMICDFGVSALLSTTSSKRNTLTGTPYWMAPEVVQTVPAYDTKADIWSMGIMIYEMIKGQPPHANLDKFKVMDLIPRAKPPRLADNEGSKDMRDFMALCLKESPIERWPADELAKTKWMKSVAKTPVAVLKELVSRLQQAGPRASLAGPLDWEEEEQNQLRYARQSNGWEFDTIRGREWLAAGYRDDESDQSLESTVRPPAASLPSSLAAIFEDGSSSQPEPWRIPTFTASSHKDAHPGAPVGPRERRDRRQGSTDSMSILDDDDNASDYVFPPKPRSTKKPPTISAVESSPKESVIDLRLLSAGLTPDFDKDTSSDTITPSVKQTPSTVRENRPFKIPPNIEVPPNDSLIGIEGQKSAEVKTPDSGSTDTSSTPQSSTQFVTRKRSQSTAESLSSRRAGWAAREDGVNLASPAAFQFPPSSKGDQASSPSQRSHSRTNDHHSNMSSSTTSQSPGAHQMTHSLDTTATARRLIPPELRSPPPMNRARSATAVPETPGGTSPESPLVPPIKPFARGRDRSGSESTGPTTMGTPGLKDVLKIPSLTSEHHMGMADLLPPSPSAVAHSRPNFSHSPSHLSNKFAVTDPSQTFRDAVSAASQAFGLPRSASPPPFDPSAATGKSWPPEQSSSGALGPIVRPLDIMALVNGSNSYSELAHTIDDLSRWLSTVETGLGSLLETSLSKQVAPIVEEQEHIERTERTTNGLQSLS